MIQHRALQENKLKLPTSVPWGKHHFKLKVMSEGCLWDFVLATGNAEYAQALLELYGQHVAFGQGEPV